MVLASHVIICMYGFWLPNDPRGSWSDFVGSWELLKFGRATTITDGVSRARIPHDPAERRAAKLALQHPPVTLTGVQALIIANAFGEYLRRSGVVILACAILPEHIHLVIARHRLPVETIVNQLKGIVTRRLKAAGLHPASQLWARGQWVVFLDSDADIARAVDYVDENPTKEGKRRQNWKFVSRV